ncbi:MAG: hypothetical protein GEU79_09675 [Acidimicrobiia bacterium]|nr:hypothetical protein [Acidimicrobiia bacterium]
MQLFAQVDFNFVDQLLQSLSELGTDIGNFLPRLVVALLILWIGNWIAKWLRTLLVKGLDKVGAGRLTQAAGIEPMLQQAGTSGIALIGQVVYFLLLIVFVQIATEVLGIAQLTGLLNQLISYLPLVVVALLVLFVAAAIANWAAGAIRPFAQSRGMSWVSTVVRVAILVIGVLAALDTLNFAPAVTSSIQNTLLQYLPLSILIAATIAFGVGGIDTARKWWAKVDPDSGELSRFEASSDTTPPAPIDSDTTVPPEV